LALKAEKPQLSSALEFREHCCCYHVKVGIKLSLKKYSPDAKLIVYCQYLKKVAEKNPRGMLCRAVIVFLL